MKRVGDLMKELGFNPEAGDGAKEAFIKHLIRVSEGVHVATPSEKREMARNPKQVIPISQSKKAPAQLSFDFDSTGTDDQHKK